MGVVTGVTLEVELDLPLEDGDVEKHRAYVKAGMSEQGAWQQIAQDVLGGMGALVQHADARPT